MIIDLQKFIHEETALWEELEVILDQLESDPSYQMSLDRTRRFHFLYQKASADLAKVATFSSEPEIRRYLDSLVARAYAETHAAREQPHRMRPFLWFFQTFPQTFRRHHKAFWLSVTITIIGMLFGGFANLFDSEAKASIIPPQFAHVYQSPSERVKAEEAGSGPESSKTEFSAMLMTHNTKVTIFTMALGMTFGIGTIVLLFYNGVILGIVIFDFVAAGSHETVFLIGWLLPHGSIEIPAILLGGQAGLILAGALIGWGRRVSFSRRMREVTPDIVTITCGAGCMLIWAGIVEAFISQYHSPSLYSAKIAFGAIELIMLIVFLSLAGRKSIVEVDD